MKPFDPKEQKGTPFGARRRDNSSEDAFNREDPKRSEYDDNVAAFARDRRPRTGRPTSERIPHHYDDSRDESRRRSFNPNFTRDNRLRDDDQEHFQHKPRFDRHDDSEGDRDFGNRSPRSDNQRSNRFGNNNFAPRGERNNTFRDRDNRASRDNDTDPFGSKPRFDRSDNFRKPDRDNRRSFGERNNREEHPYRNREGAEGREGYRGRDSRSDRPFRSRDDRDGYRGRNNHEGDDKEPKYGYYRDSKPRNDKSYPRRDNDREGGFGRDNNFDRKGGFNRKPRFEGNEHGTYKKFDRDERRSYGDRPTRGYGKGREPRGEGEYPRFDSPRQEGAIRLNRYIANSGICSRREADELIQAGVVSVNGQVVSELGSKVNPNDEVRFNGEVIKGEKKVYILMNKPKGYVTSVEDPHSDKTVMDLVKGACTERVYPVGRLDKNSLGVLLLTNDGELTRNLTHPSYNKRKIYQVTLDKPLTDEDMTKIAEGITLEDGPIFADEISCVDSSRMEIGVEIHSGRNRIVRRIFESLGYSVRKLDRVYFAGLTKKRLKRGGWRFLSPKEVAMLKSGEYE